MASLQEDLEAEERATEERRQQLLELQVQINEFIDDEFDNGTGFLAEKLFRDLIEDNYETFEDLMAQVKAEHGTKDAPPQAT